SCQSGVWATGGGIDVGPRTPLSFNVNYCLGANALVYAQIRGDVRDSMGVEIVVNGLVEAASKADTEGWYSYQSTSTILSASDCFMIRSLVATSSQRIAWFKRL
ncbi:hypothetical protein ABZQ24_29075, partial [Pseudomonas aeruginosa]